MFQHRREVVTRSPLLTRTLPDGFGRKRAILEGCTVNVGGRCLIFFQGCCSIDGYVEQCAHTQVGPVGSSIRGSVRVSESASRNRASGTKRPADDVAKRTERAHMAVDGRSVCMSTSVEGVE